ncbi:MAG: glycerol-3-phosphate dehydrogenase/oxidase [Mariprofundaceae bacterium]
MATVDYDVVIIGGGIHGCGIAQAAAAAGYSVLVLEETALAAGTSSKSSKLIHGGLRYLETAQFSLVREALHERERLLKLAPDLVHRIDFYIPVYHQTKRSPWQIRIGLSIYAIFAGMAPEVRFTTVPRSQWENLGGINTDGLLKVFRYQDAQTDDAALTRAVMQSAISLGTELQCPIRFISASREDAAYKVSYLHNEEEYQVNCRVLINAGGPWANDVLDRVTPAVDKRAVDLVQGTHIIVDQPMHQGVFFVEAPRDRRPVLFIPWHGHTLIGTTETMYTGDPAEVHPLQEEIDYLLETTHHYFPSYAGTVIDSFAGLRVLPKAEGAAFYRSRETMIHWHGGPDSRLVTIYGGKLTTYRATAEKVISQVKQRLGARPPKGDTRNISLHRIAPTE